MLCYAITIIRTHPYRGAWLLPCQYHNIYLLKHQRTSNTQNKEIKLIRVIRKRLGIVI